MLSVCESERVDVGHVTSFRSTYEKRWLLLLPLLVYQLARIYISGLSIVANRVSYAKKYWCHVFHVFVNLN